ncbi:hypothetical protein [Haloferula luteola]|uniref:hypothetical protein n=1 Tax=Haloferula luteola TaxID=595692 RepID=UPI001C850BBC|nr:hypothetical protein [Haloferula luteola]
MPWPEEWGGREVREAWVNRARQDWRVRLGRVGRQGMPGRMGLLEMQGWRVLVVFLVPLVREVPWV